MWAIAYSMYIVATFMIIPVSFNDSSLGIFVFSLSSFFYIATQIALPAFTTTKLVRKFAMDNLFSMLPVIATVVMLLIPEVKFYDALYFYIALISMVLIIDLWLIGALQGRIQFLKSEISSEE